MAGIVGNLGRDNREALARMLAALAHRGPDGQATWESAPDAAGRGALLGHRRLAILDLTPAAVQPMVDPVTGQVLVFNGEIYNYRDVRGGLQSRGEAFASSGDTAVLLRALALGGAAALSEMRGMFAVGLWDPAARQLLLARDPLGIKPLYWVSGPPGAAWSLAFASEVRALLASGLIAPRLDPCAAAAVVWNGFLVGPETAVAGVTAVGPGELLSFDGAGRQLDRRNFFCLQAEEGGAAASEPEFEAALRHSVALHLESDVPLAVCLSSGVDSSAIANLAAQTAPSLRTFTLAFEEPSFNEGGWAQRIAAAIGSDHQEIVLSEGRFVAGLEAALDSLDQPTFDGLNGYYLSQAIAEAGVKVALSGAGGDELFGGYTSFRDLPALARWGRRGGRFGRWPARLAAGGKWATQRLAPLNSGFPPQTRWAKLPDLVERGDDLLGLYQLAYALFLPETQAALLAEPDRIGDGLSARRRDQLRREGRGRSALAAVAVFEERLFLGERLLRDNDAASMAASIELRLPLVDQALWGVVDRLPDPLRFMPLRHKAILRRVGLRGLDPALYRRPKSGFVLPFERWLRRGLATQVASTLRDAAAVRAVGLQPAAVARLWEAFSAGGRGLYWSRLWAIFVFLRFCQRHRLRL